MNLSDYISLTLTEIVEGVKKANKPYVKKDKELVLSETALRIEGFPSANWDDNREATYKPIIKVAFRVGVEVEESEESNNKISGSLKVISANSEDGKRSVHEVSFELPLILP